MKKLLKALPILSKALPDLMIVAGGALISVGAGQFHPAAGYIVGGLLMMGLGILGARKAD